MGPQRPSGASAGTPGRRVRVRLSAVASPYNPGFPGGLVYR